MIQWFIIDGEGWDGVEIDGAGLKDKWGVVVEVLWFGQNQFK